MQLVVDDVSCGYAKHQPVQEHVSFTVNDGEICCVLGPNGCGKTTLFKSLLGFMPLLAGHIRIDNEDTEHWTPSRMASYVAYVAQSHQPPFPYLVKDVVMMGRVNSIGYMGNPTAKDLQIVNDAMRDMDVYDMRDRVYSDLSGGELQLVMIARAIAQQPKVLVLDEPTAALDYGNTMRVIQKVRELGKQGFAVVMTTHSPDHAFMCGSNVVLLRKDQPMIFGPADRVITEDHMRSAYGVDIRIIEFINARDQVTRLCAPVV
jgi:iron complex transport system ATP-binding protein